MTDTRYGMQGATPAPAEIEGRVLLHNHIRHGPRTPCGPSGFRWWTAPEVPEGFEHCGCGWMGLPHYARQG